jgi:hypothetical protein
MASAGVQTAALWGGGSPTSAGTFEYDGTDWTAGGDMTFAGRDFSGGGVGTQTAALCIGGFISPSSNSNVMQEYNGSSWANIPQTYPNAAGTPGFSSCGTQTAVVSSGGPSPSGDNFKTRTWDGTSWTDENNLNIGHSGAVQRGTSTAAVVISGTPSSPPGYGTEIQTWDGTNWSTSPATLVTARAQAGGGGNTTSCFVASGSTTGGPYTNATEIYSGPALATLTLTTS